MSDGDFIDSNVFVYLFDPTEPAKTSIAETLIWTGIESGEAATSFQVVQETLSVLVRELHVSAETARQFMDDVLVPLWKVMPSRDLYARTFEVHARYGYAFYDSLIIAAALSAGCARLYSEDLQHGQRIEGLTIQNPFAA